MCLSLMGDPAERDHLIPFEGGYTIPLQTDPPVAAIKRLFKSW